MALLRNYLIDGRVGSCLCHSSRNLESALKYNKRGLA
jgi:hypothetical protein